jgi:hypothetical protein
MDRSMSIILGVAWFFGGLVWLWRGIMRDEVFPTAPISLFTKPESQSDRDRAKKVLLGVLNLMIGCVYLLTAIFHHH